MQVRVALSLSLTNRPLSARSCGISQGNCISLLLSLDTYRSRAIETAIPLSGLKILAPGQIIEFQGATNTAYVLCIDIDIDSRVRTSE